jgi:hypothetical protein
MDLDLYNEILEKNCDSYNRSFYVSTTLMIIIFILIIISFVNLEKLDCPCVNIPEKRFLKEWFIIGLIIWVLIIGFFLLGDESCYLKFLNSNGLYIFIIIFAIINYIMLFRLLLFLRIMRNKCECGYGNIEKILFWYLVIMFSFVALMVLLGLIIMIATAIKFK